MKILFVHQNFPGQFIHLAPALAKLPGHEVHALGINAKPVPAGIKVNLHKPAKRNSKHCHPLLTELESKIIRGESAYLTAKSLKLKGFVPDVIFAHPGWGESLFLSDLWPSAKLALYCELHYRATDGDSDFDPEFRQEPILNQSRLRFKNINSDLNFATAARGISPTHWQKSTYPEHYHQKIDVIHDGIDTNIVCPRGDVWMKLNHSLTLTKQDEIITFVNRNLEPHRGYHIFMRSLPKILQRRPKARVIIVGGDDVSYGTKPITGTWKQKFFNEVKGSLDISRIHFVGKLPYTHFIQLLQLSTVHIYLTYPFVLSWSLLEAMSAGCAIIASDTAPVREVIEHNRTGLLTDFFDYDALAERTVALIKNQSQRQQLSTSARQHITQHYDLKTLCLPKQIEWIHSVAKL